jgi:hypothetical protein
MKDSWDAVRLPWREEFVAPVTILDAQGRLVRTVPAAEFRRLHSGSPNSAQSPRAEGGIAGAGPNSRRSA